MTMCIDEEIEVLRKMTVKQLQHRYAEVFGEPTRAHNKPYLWKRIAWRLQVQAEGDISARARRRAKEIAREEDLRLCPPKGSFAPTTPAARARTTVLPFSPPERDERLPSVGTMLGRIYKGRRVEVEVLETGFRHNEQLYPTLTAVAQAVTGTHWNGYEFFGLRKRKRS